MSGSGQTWSEPALHHFTAGYGAGLSRQCTGEVGRGRAGAVSWGTEVEVEIHLADDGSVAALRWLCHGCPAVQAACSWLAEQASGQMPSDLRRVGATGIAEALELPPERLGVLLVVEDALQAAVASAAGEHSSM